MWRPLYRVVEDCPIAVCDPLSMDTNDLLAADRVTPDFAVKLYYLKYNVAQKWYWLRHHTPDELLVFVNFDSDNRLEGPKWLSE